MQNLTKKIFPVFILLLLSSSMASCMESLFDPSGSLVDSSMAASFSFPDDLSKTNLHVAKNGQDGPFEWAGRLISETNTSQITCSAGAFKLPNSQPEDKVLVLTSGHCLPGANGTFLSPFEAISNKTILESDRQIYFSLSSPRSIYDPSGDLQKLEASELSKIVFASLDVFDIAILELPFTYKQMEVKQKIPTLIFKEVKVGDRIKMSGVPQSPTYTSDVVHQTECSVKNYKSKVEAELGPSSSKYFIENVMLSNCTLMHGMSGGYVRNDKGELIGVNSGGVDDAAFFTSARKLESCVENGRNFNAKCLNKIAASIRDQNSHSL